MRQELIRLSKTVSHALRHAPWLYELELDEQGWADADLLLDALRQHRKRWHDLSMEALREMVETNDKQRFEMTEGLIRARYGHSLPDKLKKTPGVPPDLLYHGTAISIVPLIMVEGLQPMRRQYVHLSVEEGTAQQVAQRKGEQTVILTILAGKAHNAGTPFYEGNHIVWLADIIPPEFIEE